MWMHGYKKLPDGTKPLLEPILTYNQQVLWHLHKTIFPGKPHDINLSDECENYSFKITAKFPRGQWLQMPV